MKFLRSLALALAASIVLTGCVTISPERDAAQVVATVNGENITKKQVYDYLGMTFDTALGSETSQVKAQKENALETLIYQKVVVLTAKEKGMYNFTADEQKTIDDYISSYTKGIYEASLANWQDKAKTDSTIDPAKKAQEDVDNALSSLGLTSEALRKNEESSVAFTKLQKSVTDSITVSDSDVENAYNDLVNTQTTSYTTDPSQLISDDLNGSTIVYYPSDGFIRVKHILIKLDDTTADEISTLRKDGKTDEANAKRDEALKAIADKANAALTKAKAASGKLDELDKLTTDPGEDPGMKDRKLGYPTHKDYTGYAEEFQNAAMKLTEIGVPTDLVASDFGYHIIWLTEKCPNGKVPLADVKDAYKETVLTSKKNSAWNDAVTQYVEDYDSKGLIKRFTNRLAGK